MLRKNKNKKSVWKHGRTYFVGMFFVITFLLVLQVWGLGVLPIKYFLIMIIVIVCITSVLIYLQYGNNNKAIHRSIGTFFQVVCMIVFGIGNIGIYQALDALGKASITSEYEVISVIVKEESTARELIDVKEETFAVAEGVDQENTQKAILDIQEILDTTIEIENYRNLEEGVAALYRDACGVFILNEAYRSLLEMEYPAFNTETKVIYTFKMKKEIANLGKQVDVTSKPYNLYISGIDTYGVIGTKSRSDVNMIATIHPKTKQVLLTSIPRDYYIPQTCQNGQKDKLTHTGIFGIDCTVNSMQQFTGLTFHYYARVNFSSVETIVDAIGGIEIYNEKAFTGVGDVYFGMGNLSFDGPQALQFVRERKAFAQGDIQRGRNQMIVLEAMIDKITSPAILTGYSGIMGAIGGSFQTNMEADEMISFMKMQIDKGGSWNVVQQSLEGNGENGVWSPANQTYSYMMHPDMNSVNEALLKVQKVLDGEIIGE